MREPVREPWGLVEMWIEVPIVLVEVPRRSPAAPRPEMTWRRRRSRAEAATRVGSHEVDDEP